MISVCNCYRDARSPYARRRRRMCRESSCVGSASERQSYIPTVRVSQTKCRLGVSAVSATSALKRPFNTEVAEIRKDQRPETRLRSFTFENYIEHTGLKHLPVDGAFLDCDRIFNLIHRIILFRVALKMDLRDQRLISRTNCDQVEVCAAPERWRARWIGSIGNRANALEFVLTCLG